MSCTFQIRRRCAISRDDCDSTRIAILLVAALALACPPRSALGQCEAVQDGKLVASDGTSGDRFGSGVAIHGDIALIGSPLDDDNGPASGSVYFYRNDGLNWADEVKLLGDGVSSSDLFGTSVALLGDVAAVGAVQDDGRGENAGAAYVFRFDGSNWVQEAKLLAGDGAAGDHFGASLALHGEVVVIGAVDLGASSGAAYVFRYDGSNWIEETKLEAGDAAEGDRFGVDVALYGDTVVVGAEGDDDDGVSSGSAYVFHHDGSSWTQEAKLLAGDAAEGDRFGVGVAVYVDMALIGAAGDSELGDDAGAAYVFRRSGSTWSQESKLLADDGVSGDSLGSSVATHQGTAVVGAPANGPGSAYIFRFDGSDWQQDAKIQAEDGVGGAAFGERVAVHGSNAVIAASLDTQNGNASGSAYVFDVCFLSCDAPEDCDDGVSCTVESCVEGECVFTPSDESCPDDGLFCNGDEICDARADCVSTGDPCSEEIACDERTDSCREPVGACCVGGGCLVDLEETFCREKLEGVYAGDFSVCDEGVCAFGACCLTDGECTDGLEFTCDDVGGVFQGINTECASADCPQPAGACCVDGECLGDLQEIDCLDAGGEWAGPFTNCDEDLCRRGACCLEGGSCEDLHPAACEEAGGLFAGDETDCATSPCTEACCREGSDCEDIARQVCVDNGDTPAGLGTDCAESLCMGVCCINVVCVDGQEEDDCVGAGGRWAGLFTNCEDDPDICAGCTRDPAWLCDGDVDGDGVVNPVDVGLVQAVFGSTEEFDLCQYDVDCDGEINPVDSGLVESLFGTCDAPRESCP